MAEATKGTIQVTAENPVATVDLSVTANAALRSAPTNATEVAIGSTFSGGSAGDPAMAKTLVTVEALEGPPQASTDAFPYLRSFLDEGCGAGDCTRHYRITVVLIDPEADRATFDWVATASSHFGPGGATGSPPPEARLKVTAEPPALVPADRLTRTTVTPDSVRIDASHPRTVVRYDLTRAPDVATSGDSAKLLLRLDANDDDPNVFAQRATVTVRLGDVQVASVGLTGRLQLMPVTLTATCDDPIGCVEPLIFQFEWEGGDPANVVDQAWSLTGVAIAPEDGPATRLAFGAESRTVLTTEDPHLTATTSGSFDIGKDNFRFLDATVTLDASLLEQGQGGVHGVVQGTVTATTTAAGGTAKTQVMLVIEQRSASGSTGEPLAATGRLVALDCEGRSRCPTVFGFGASMGQTDAVDAHVEWTLTVVFLPDPPGTIPPEIELLLETAPRPKA